MNSYHFYMNSSFLANFHTLYKNIYNGNVNMYQAQNMYKVSKKNDEKKWLTFHVSLLS